MAAHAPPGSTVRRLVALAAVLALIPLRPVAAAEPAAVRQLRVDLRSLVTVDHPPTALQVALAAGLVAALAATDPNVAASGRHHLPDELGRVESWGRVGATNTVGVALVAGGFVVGERRGWVGGLTLLEGNLILGATLDLSKRAFGRARPDEPNAGRLRQGGQSLPSSHAAHAFLIASVLDATFHRPAIGWVAYAAAAAVALSRVQAGVHFPTDVVAGGALGWWVGHRLSVAHRLTDDAPHRLHVGILPSRRGAVIAGRLSL